MTYVLVVWLVIAVMATVAYVLMAWRAKRRSRR